MNEIEMIQRLSVENDALRKELTNVRSLVILYANHSPQKHRFTKTEQAAAMSIGSISYRQLQDGTITIKVNRVKKEGKANERG